MSEESYPRRTLSEPAVCPRCGAEFHCSKSGRCWCYSVDIPADMLERVQEEYAGCLCPACLKAFAERR